MMAYWPRVFSHDFIASKEWWTISLCTALAGTALFAKVMWIQGAQPGVPAISRPMRTALLTPFAFFALYSMLVCGLGGGATWMGGKNTTDIFAAYRSPSAGPNCLRLEEADTVVCMSPEKFKLLPPSPRVKLDAKRSWFGTIVYGP
jgi:hypothetical protein